jgi:hypothetical protein
VSYRDQIIVLTYWNFFAEIEKTARPVKAVPEKDRVSLGKGSTARKETSTRRKERVRALLFLDKKNFLLSLSKFPNRLNAVIPHWIRIH